MSDISNDAEYKKYLIAGETQKIINENPYDLVLNAYHGSGGFHDGKYLIPHAREVDFANRVNYSHNINVFRPILDALINPVYQSPPERRNESNSAEWELFSNNCDLKGSNLDQFFKQTAMKAKRDGVVFVLMDNFQEVPKSKKEALDKRAIPYIYTKKAKECIYYKIDKWGKLSEIAFTEPAGASTKDKEAETYIRKWTNTTWEVYKAYDAVKDIFVDQVEAGVNPIGRLPIIKVMTGDAEIDPVLPLPPLYDVARLQVAIYNLCSEAREIMRKAGFPFLAIPVGTGGFPKEIQLGSAGILGYPMDSSNKPEYISPDVSIIDVYTKMVSDLIEESYKLGRVAGVTGVLEQSGRAKAWDFQATKTELSILSRVMEQAERDTAEMFSLWTNDQIDVTIHYNEDFGVGDTMEDLAVVERIIALGVPVDVGNLLKKDVLSGYLSKYDRETRDEVNQQIDNDTTNETESKKVNEESSPE
jgi:hypothetical protein